jgi:hypothetical protein
MNAPLGDPPIVVVVVVGVGVVVVVVGGPARRGAARRAALTVPPRSVHFSADRLMLHFMPLTQSRDVVQATAGFFRHVPVLRSHGPNFGRRHATKPSFTSSARRSGRPRRRPGHGSFAASATQLT